MKKRILHNIAPFLGLILFALALLVLHHELRQYHYHDIAREFAAIPLRQILLAIMLTIAGYIVLTGYDTLATHYVQHSLGYPKIAMASFISYAFSNNLGFALLTGAPIRYRLYSAWGLSAIEITNMVAFGSLTFWLGYLTLAGIAFSTEPFVVPGLLHLPFGTVRPLGFIFLAIVISYVVFAFSGRRPLKIREWTFPPPSKPLVLGQLTVASLDWAISAGVLYSLLPRVEGLSFFGFLGLFLLAQVSGVLSQVPGGLGVFETIAILLLSPYMPVSAVLGSLLAYRGIYYILPLCIAAIMLGTHEVVARRHSLVRVLRFFGTWAPQLVPQVFAFTTLLAGTILLFSGATPAVSHRMAWLHNFLPLPVLEVSHFVGSIAGVGLLILARGLQRRLDAAYHLTILVLIAGIAVSLLKGFDFEEAIALAIMLAALAPCRKHFYRKASLFSERFTAGWVAAIIFILISSTWLGFFAHKKTPYSQELWWQFTFHGDAPRFLRALVGTTGTILIFAIARLLRAAPPEIAFAGEEELEKANSIAGSCKSTYASLALLGDKKLLFSDTGNSFIMYGVRGRSWVALGDPIGLEEEKVDVIWKFRELCDLHDGWPIFYQVHAANLPIYLDLGLTLLKLGEEARVPLDDFSLDGRPRKWLRYIDRRFEEKEGCSFEIRPTGDIPALLEEFRLISDAWLSQKNTREKGFSLGFFSEAYLTRFPAALVLRENRIMAFANIWMGGGKEELSVDLMRYLSEAPSGIMEYLFIKLMMWGKQEGYRWFNLGMAPLSGLENRALASTWNRLGALIYRFGEHYYNFQGLRHYKDKFIPVWEPKYLASPGGLSLPPIFADISALISGSIKGVVTK